MDDRATQNRKHIFLEGYTETQSYVSPGQGFPKPINPSRDRNIHGNTLRHQLQELQATATVVGKTLQSAGVEDGLGIQVDFESFPDVEIAFERLARERSGIELMNIRKLDRHYRATVFVPDGKLSHFDKLIADYLEEKRNRRGHLLDHSSLLETIQHIRAATFESLWTDDAEFFPSHDEEQFWWEVWLPVRRDRERVVRALQRGAELQGLRVASGRLDFQERTVMYVHGCAKQMKDSMIILNNIAELRRAKETAEFFDEMQPHEQLEWLEELLSRTRFSPDDPKVPYACLLDTGVNRAHPLLVRALDSTDMHSCVPAWGSSDSKGHGTRMAGLALAGNLTDALEGGHIIGIDHRLESVKLLPPDQFGATTPPHYGHRTVEAVSRPEITAPFRRRVFAMTITARDGRDRGRPSSWSASLDLLARGDGNGVDGRLMIVAAGNVDDNSAWTTYPDSNVTDGIHDPGQAWNVLTVGAFTNLVRITETECSGHVPIAQRGALSPFSTTSAPWDPFWPLKPDIVLEGGNASKDHLGAIWLSSLSLLTTNHLPDQEVFATANGTSAATALAARLAAQVLAVYPDLWPETVRALIIHSAEWTSSMKKMFLPRNKPPLKSDFMHLVRSCGFGVPNLERALWSVSNSLTMVIQESLTPFKKGSGSHISFHAMHYHDLPWPENTLTDLGQIEVEMRVTLSYFIEPNPSRRGHRSRYRYQSHGLRFDIKRPTESASEFRSRINRFARDGEGGARSTSDDPNWMIGSQNRHKGSIHADIWRGSAADLASRGLIAVWPSTGWWKTRPAQQRYDESVRYALVISVRAAEVDVDLYTEVANLVVTETEIDT